MIDKWLQFLLQHIRRIRLALAIIRHEGFKAVLHRYKNRSSIVSGAHYIGQNDKDYSIWYERNQFNQKFVAQTQREIQLLPLKPKFSLIVPVCDVEQKWLSKMVGSVQHQIYENWQLCLVDDGSSKSYIGGKLKHFAAEDKRICIQLNPKRKGIVQASNDALLMATGDYVGFLDHDDELSIDALYQNLKKINAYPETDVLYSDEDKICPDGTHVSPFFKPDYSPDLIESQNYICHFTVIRKDIINRIGGFRLGFDGAQDHDLLLRAITQSKRVVHIPKVLYHWRKIPGSTAAVYDSKSYAWEAGRKAVEDHVQRDNTEATVVCGKIQGTYRVKRQIKGRPKISIIIPFKDQPKLLQRCINSILIKSSYDHFEIICIDNGSELEQTANLIKILTQSDSRIKFFELNQPFNFSWLCNFGVAKAKGDYLILLNNDIEIMSTDWIENLLEHAQRPAVGAVGGKLFYPDKRIQHAGIVVGMVGAAGHPHKFFHQSNPGYYARLQVVSNVSAVTAAMLMVAKQKYDLVGGFDQCNLKVAYNDVHFSLQLVEQGYVNVFTPFCQAIHHESASRGYEDRPEKIERMNQEKDWFIKRWQALLDSGDPFYNPNLSLKDENFTIQLNKSKTKT